MFLKFADIFKYEDGKKIEIEHGHFISILRIEKEVSGRINIYFDNPLIFVNCLPVPMELEIETRGLKKPDRPHPTLKFHLLKPQEELFVQTISLSQHIYIRLKLSGKNIFSFIRIFDLKKLKAIEFSGS